VVPKPTLPPEVKVKAPWPKGGVCEGLTKASTEYIKATPRIRAKIMLIAILLTFFMLATKYELLTKIPIRATKYEKLRKYENDFVLSYNFVFRSSI